MPTRKVTINTFFAVSYPFVFGFIAATQLCGINMCSFAPLTLFTCSFVVAITAGTILASFLSDLSWKVIPSLFTLPMLLPVVVSGTSLTDEWPRLLVALTSIFTSWLGSYSLRSRLEA